MSATFTQPAISIRSLINQFYNVTESVGDHKVKFAMMNAVNVREYLSAYDGSYDAYGDLQRAINDFATVIIPVGTNVAIGYGVTLHHGHNLIGQSGLGNNNYSEGLASQITSLTDSGTINLRSQSSIDGVTFTRDGASTTATALVGFTGTAINSPNNVQVTDVSITNCNIFGYGIGIGLADGSLTYTRGRIYVKNINMDCDVGIDMDYVLDTCYFDSVHQWPFLGNGIVNNVDTTVATGASAARDIMFQFGTRTDWVHIDKCFSHSTFKFLDGTVGGFSITGGGYDFEAYGGDCDSNAVGMNISSTGDGAVNVANFSFNGGFIHAVVNMADADDNNNTASFVGCAFDRADNMYIQVQSGIVTTAANKYKTETALVPGGVGGTLGLPDWIGTVATGAKVIAIGNLNGQTVNGTVPNQQWGGTGEIIESDNHTIDGTVLTTVAGLPAAADKPVGSREIVTDANATTFNSTVAGGGANTVPVFTDGTNWKIG